MHKPTNYAHTTLHLEVHFYCCWWVYENMIGASPFCFCVHGYWQPSFENNDILKFLSQVL
jgi:hypothetical protein